jgi:putative phage-type endonuclease
MKKQKSQAIQTHRIAELIHNFSLSTKAVDNVKPARTVKKAQWRKTITQPERDQLLSVDQSGPSFENARAGGIGASEVGEILGLSKYRSYVDAWRRHTGQVAELETEGFAMDYGHETEDQGAKHYGAAMNATVTTTGIVVHPTFVVLQAALDRKSEVHSVHNEFSRNDSSTGAAEFKSPIHGVPCGHVPELPLHTPVHNVPQLQVQMECAGLKWDDFVSFWKTNPKHGPVALPEFDHLLFVERNFPWMTEAVNGRKPWDIIREYSIWEPEFFLVGRMFVIRNYHDKYFCNQAIRVLKEHIHSVETHTIPDKPKVDGNLIMLPMKRVDWVQHSKFECPDWDYLFPNWPCGGVDLVLQKNVASRELLKDCIHEKLTLPWGQTFLTVFVTSYPNMKPLVSNAGFFLSKSPF